jgi:secreted Zn-dependent insulinase-like peptidase
MRGVWGMSFYVTSKVQDPNYVSEMTEVFLEGAGKRLLGMGNEEFEGLKGGAVAILREPHKNVYDRSGSHFEEIYKGSFGFDSARRDVESMGEIGLGDFQWTFDDVFRVKGKRLEIHVLSQDRKEVSVGKRKERVEKGAVRYVSTPEWFKGRMPMYPDFWWHDL